MAQSITLQTSDSDIISGDILGRLSFAASSETSGSDALLIGAGIYAEAEDTFTQIGNATSLIFSTASSETATGKLKITSGGYFLPLLNNTYDIGSSSFVFRNLYVNSGIFTNLSVSGINVSLSGHSHTSSNITDFNSSVSGLLPVTNIVSGSGITVSSSGGSFTINSSGLVATTDGRLTKTLARFTARDNYPPVTNFATLDTRNSVLVLEFDAATEESATFIGVIPENATLISGIIVRLWWMGDTATSGNVQWGVQLEDTGTDLDADSYDTNSQVTSAVSGTSGIESLASITITTIDSLASGDRFRLRVYRVATDATNDTMTGDAQLVAVEVRAA